LEVFLDIFQVVLFAVVIRALIYIVAMCFLRRSIGHPGSVRG
jgi:hypothetical protein